MIFTRSARREGAGQPPRPAATPLHHFMKDYSIEVMPRTAGRIDDFRQLLPEGTRIYIAHIADTPIEDMVNTARRLGEQGFCVMPHFPARLIKDTATLGDWIARYQGEAGVSQALLLAGGGPDRQGAFASSLDLIETGLFDAHGFKRLHVAGHPEGNRDIDPDGGTTHTDRALLSKHHIDQRTDAAMAIVTQFCFDAAPVIAWADRLKRMGVGMPIHIGVAGPAKLQTLIKFSIACGIGPSFQVLKKRAKDISKLIVPFTPMDVLTDLAAHKMANPDFNVTNVHLFPLGGIAASAQWAATNGGAACKPAAHTAHERHHPAQTAPAQHERPSPHNIKGHEGHR